MLSYESQTILAKILARENVNIVYSNKLETASFDMEKRILYIPIWTFSDEVYITFIAHEVSHALHTPTKKWMLEIPYFGKEYEDVYKKYLNIIEDIRIDAKIKRLYKGLPRYYYSAIEFLVKSDFFGVKKYKYDTTQLNLIDKINLFSKCKNRYDVENDVPYPLDLSKDEFDLIQKILLIETWEDTVYYARKIFESEKANIKKSSEFITNNLIVKTGLLKDGGEGVDDNEDDEDNEENQTLIKQEKNSEENEDDNEEDDISEQDSNDDSEKQENNGEQKEGGDGDGDGDENNEDENNGDEDDGDGDENNEDENNENLENNNPGDSDGSDGSDDDRQDANPDEIAISIEILNSKTYDNSEKHLSGFVDKTIRSGIEYIKIEEYDRSICKNVVLAPTKIFLKFKKYDNTIKFVEKEKYNINYMVSRFEAKKRANELKRDINYKTGLLDTNRLHDYKHSDDIFKRSSYKQEGKNYGFIFVIDYSSSMRGVYSSLIKQLLFFIFFCKKVGIPFDVYGFRTDTGYNTVNVQDIFENKKTKMINFMNSRMSKEELYSVIEFFLSNDFSRLSGFTLSSTGLNSSICFMNGIIDDFKQKYNPDILNVVYITDGQSDSSISSYGTSFLQSDKSKIQVGFGQKTEFKVNTEALLKLLKLNNPSINLKGYFITSSTRSRKSSIPTDVDVRKVKENNIFTKYGEKLGYDDYTTINNSEFINAENYRLFLNDFIDSII